MQEARRKLYSKHFLYFVSRLSVEDIHNMHANLNIIYGTTIKYFKTKVQNVVCLRVDCVKTQSHLDVYIYCIIRKGVY